jgi:hypothetical protein
MLDMIEGTRRHGARREDQNVKIIVWNAGGLRNKLDDAVERLRELEADVMVVVETWIRLEDALPPLCRRVSAICSEANQGSRRGQNGVTIVVNPDRAEGSELQDMEVIVRDFRKGQYAVVKIGRKVLIGCYIPPESMNLGTVLEEAMEAGEVCRGDEVIICGDFNARRVDWGDRISNRLGHELGEFCENHGLNRVDTGVEATFVHVGQGESIVDHVLVSEGLFERSKAWVDEAIGHGSLFHRPIVFEIEAGQDEDGERRARRPRRRIRLEKLRDEATRREFAEAGGQVCNELFG